MHLWRPPAAPSAILTPYVAALLLTLSFSHLTLHVFILPLYCLPFFLKNTTTLLYILIYILFCLNLKNKALQAKFNQVHYNVQYEKILVLSQSLMCVCVCVKERYIYKTD